MPYDEPYEPAEPYKPPSNLPNINCPLRWLSVGDIPLYLGLIGLTMLEYGICRRGFGKHIILKNWLQFSVGITAWWLVGYAFAFGDAYHNEFIGRRFFGGDEWLTQKEKYHGSCASYFGLSGIFVVFIINGAIVEKVRFVVYPIISFCIMAFIWPVVVAWDWGGGGWLMIEFQEFEAAMVDFGGTIQIFLVAGGFGLMGAVISGRRAGKYEKLTEKFFNIGNYVIYALGAALTMLGIISLTVSLAPTDSSRGLGAVNSWICGSLSAITSYMIILMFRHDLNTHYISIYQGFIAGQVAIASSAFNTTPWQAGIVGIITGIWFILWYSVGNWLKIDDPINIAATFMMPAGFGTFLPGFITDSYGCFWQDSKGYFLAAQTAAALTVFPWALAWGAIIFGFLKLFGLLKLDNKLQVKILENEENKLKDENLAI
ncbi:amt_3 [Blepharisma stoltei]|uniref:Ammonium transporter AmtB-like domain-containing protein n=1 Tax=Blepharisma stoltei TaxID=1481888 RepID=A0AAU9J7L8_9CILI|nr:unnamed protein product [Blepharisma stoltei]